MEKFLVKDKVDWIKREKEIKGLNIQRDPPSPTKFPCIAIKAYRGEGWDELGFCYLSDFGEEYNN